VRIPVVHIYGTLFYTEWVYFAKLRICTRNSDTRYFSHTSFTFVTMLGYWSSEIFTMCAHAFKSGTRNIRTSPSRGFFLLLSRKYGV